MNTISRAGFLKTGLSLAAGTLFQRNVFKEIIPDRFVMTVRGRQPATSLGYTLSHEHIMVDFIGAAEIKPGRYEEKEVFEKAMTAINELKKTRFKTLVECTPDYLGRDVSLLKKLSEASGIHIITNTGYYGAAKEKYLPAHAYTESASQLSKRWIAEWENGINGTGIKPGMIKTGVYSYPLSAVQQKIVEAAALTSRSTGLVVGVHTGNGKAAAEEMRIIRSQGVLLSSWIWIHAQNEKDRNYHFEAARAGGWISFDGYVNNKVSEYVKFLSDMKTEKLLTQVLISQDAGWYHVGEPGGGNYRLYNDIEQTLIPALSNSGFTDAELKLIFELNPASAFSIRN